MDEGHSSKELEMFNPIFRALIFAAVITAATATNRNCQATLVYYYDPLTGNVSFDSTNVVNGGIYNFGLGINESQTELRFNYENHVKITNSAYFDSSEDLIAEISNSAPLYGYFTMGDVLPPGLSEETWTTTFAKSVLYEYHFSIDPGFHLASAPRESGPGSQYAGADFVYGQPDRDFDNKWDLIDPDELEWADAATLIYNQTTGELAIDSSGESGGHITWVFLETDGLFIPENFTPWNQGQFTSASANYIGIASNAQEPGVYGIGAVLPSGMSYEELEASLLSARFIARAGYGGATNFDFDTESIELSLAVVTSNVPEPNAALLLILAVSALNFSHKRAA